MAPFTDAAAPIDPTNFSTTVHLVLHLRRRWRSALDLTLRDRSNGKITLDDYMRAMWGKGRAIADARARLAGSLRRPRISRRVLRQVVEGREVADYARLLLRAGLVLRKRSPGAAWIGPANLIDASGTISNLMPWGSPRSTPGSIRET